MTYNTNEEDGGIKMGFPPADEPDKNRSLYDVLILMRIPQRNKDQARKITKLLTESLGGFAPNSAANDATNSPPA